MATPASVVGCSTCGALYTPSPGDGRVCDACRVSVADDSAAHPEPTPLFASEEGGGSRSQRGRSVPRPARRRGLARKIVKSALVVALFAGTAAGAFAKRQELARTWSWLRHHTVSEGWEMLRDRSAQAWVSVRQHIPIAALQPDTSSADPNASDTSPAKAGHRRKNKRAKGDHVAAK